jgi:hypothetical protein
VRRIGGEFRIKIEIVRELGRPPIIMLSVDISRLTAHLAAGTASSTAARTASPRERAYRRSRCSARAMGQRSELRAALSAEVRRGDLVALLGARGASTMPLRSSSTSAVVTRSGRPCHGADTRPRSSGCSGPRPHVRDERCGWWQGRCRTWFSGPRMAPPDPATRVLDRTHP